MDAGPGETPPVIPPPESAYRPPAAAQADNAIAYERGPALTGERGVANLAAAAVPKSIVMEPAEERPPEPSIPMLPPEAEIAPIPPRVNPPAAPKTGPVEIPEAYILPEIAAAPRSRPVPETAKPEPVRAEPVSPGVEDAAPDRTADVQFSAPLITTLEKGKYYLQLRAYTKTDLVELELTRLGSGYPLAVQAGESQEKPLYRILVGPMNLGETNALLRRFKGNGYNDAFVKKGE
jgi:hypothetical protein